MKDKAERNNLEIVKDGTSTRLFLNGSELKFCTKFALVQDTGSDSKSEITVTLQIARDFTVRQVIKGQAE